MPSRSVTEFAPASGQPGRAALPIRLRTPRWAELVFAERTVGAVFLLFVATVFLLGGGSRGDIASLVVLRPLAVLGALYAVLAMRPGAMAENRPLIIGLGLIAALIGAQLIPLPPDVWSQLPGREVYAQAVSIGGAGGIWRPASLVPSATLNALLSLTVPLAGLLLYGALAPRHRDWWVRAVLAIGLASAMLGFIQIAGPPGSALYFYRITNETEAVGLFANRNHHAVVLAALIPLAAWCCRTGFLGRSAMQEPAGLRQGIFLFMILALILAVLATGSRAGLICAALMLGWASLMLRESPSRGGRGWQRWVWLSPLALGLLGAGAAVLASRGTGIDRLAGADSLGGIRFQVLPTLGEMAHAFFPAGAGYGSFAQAYRQFEPDALLRPEYLNHAHNDWLQVVIEGGLPALVGLFVGAGWLLRQLVRGIRLRETRLAAMTGGGIWLCFAAASVVDYPLRVPAVMLLLVLASTMLARPPSTLLPRS